MSFICTSSTLTTRDLVVSSLHVPYVQCTGNRCHDKTFKRLAHASESKVANEDVSTLRSMDIDDILFVDNRSKPSKLLPILRLAKSLEGGKKRLVIEIKPTAPDTLLKVLLDRLEEEPELLEHVAVLMSFNHSLVEKLVGLFEERADVFKGRRRPKFLLLTRCSAAAFEGKSEYQIREIRRRALETEGSDKGILDFTQVQEVDAVMRSSKADGMYMQFSSDMIEKSTSHLASLCKTYDTVGIWNSASRGDPDTVHVASRLMEAGVAFVNTDVPFGFTPALLT